MTLYSQTIPMHRMPQYYRTTNCSLASFPIDIKEEEDAYLITAALPGVEADKLNIEIKNDELTIQGEFESRQENTGAYIMAERPSGSFSRKLLINTPIDADKTEASLKNGILTLRIPKSEKAFPKTIKVNAN